MAPIFTLLTDFGTADSYVAEMKAAILAREPRAVLVDISHEVPAYGIEAGAFQLLRAHRHFPRGTRHVAVVDPGVGSARLPIWVRTRDYHFIGPDNGLLLWAVRACEAREGRPAKAFVIPETAGLLPTFHGRDLFAPFAAEKVAKPPRQLRAVAALNGRAFPAATPHLGGWRSEILVADRFGNLVTAIPHWVEGEAEGTVQGSKYRLRSAANYAGVVDGTAALIRGSHGFWEIACGRGSAAALLGVGPGAHVTIVPR